MPAAVLVSRLCALLGLGCGCATQWSVSHTCHVWQRTSIHCPPPPTPKPSTAEEQAKLDAAAELEQRVVAWAHKERIEKQRTETCANALQRARRPVQRCYCFAELGSAQRHPCDASPHRSLRARISRGAPVPRRQTMPQRRRVPCGCATSNIGGKRTACPVAATICATSASAISARLTRCTRPLQPLLCGRMWSEQCWRNLECCLPAKGGAARTKRHADIVASAGSPLPCARVMHKLPARHTGHAQRRVLGVLMPPRWTQRPSTPLG